MLWTGSERRKWQETRPKTCHNLPFFIGSSAISPAGKAIPTRQSDHTSSPRNTVTAWPIKTTRSPSIRTFTTPPRHETWWPLSESAIELRRPVGTETAMRGATHRVFVDADRGGEEPRHEIMVG